jgi:hypothetical protein
VDIEKLKEKIESTIKSDDFPENLSVKIDGVKGKYTLESKLMRLTIKIDKQWIGYDLDIKKSVLGKKIGTFSDTDNYPLHDEYEKASLITFEEVSSCLDAIFENRVYVGKDKKEYYLAVPLNEKEYKLVTRTSIFSGSSRTVSRKDIENDKRLYKLESREVA